MDKEYIARHNLTKAHKQFMRLAEGYISSELAEADDEEAPDMNGQQPPMGGGQGDMPPMGDDPNQQPPMDGGQGDMPPMDGGPNQQPPMGDEQGDMPPMDGGQGDMPPMDGGMPEGPMDDGGLGENDEVIDVEDLTQAQEKLNHKQNMVGKDLGQLDNRIEALMTAVEKMKNIIDHNNNEITSLKAELQKRVPTQTEKLGMRSLDSYPYNVNLNDYWKNKEREGGYEARYNNSQPEDKSKIITNKDINNFSDSDIENSFDDDDLNQTMEKIFKGF